MTAVWPPHDGPHYQRRVLDELTRGHKIKWLDDSTITAGAMTITANGLDELMETSPVWPVHQEYIDRFRKLNHSK